jgi:hypothetical protein
MVDPSAKPARKIGFAREERRVVREKLIKSLVPGP